MKLIKTAAVALGAYWLYGQYLKKRDAYKGVTAKIVNIKNVNLTPQALTLEIDLLLHNPSGEHINLNGNSPIKLNGANLTDQGNTPLGRLDLDLTEIHLTPNNSQTITGIPVTLPVHNAPAILEVLKMPSRLKVELQFAIAGQQLKI